MFGDLEIAEATWRRKYRIHASPPMTYVTQAISLCTSMLIPITWEQRHTDFSKPYRHLGYDWWVSESPIFRPGHGVTWVKAVRWLD